MGREPITRFNTFQHTSTHLGVPALRSLWFLILLSTLFLHIKKKPLIFGCAGFSLLCMGSSLVAVRGLLTVVASPVVEQALGAWASVVAAHGLSSCAPGLWSTGLVVVVHGFCHVHLRSSCTGDQTQVSCTGRKILYN